MVSEIEFGGLVFVVNLPARWAHFILVLTPAISRMYFKLSNIWLIAE